MITTIMNQSEHVCELVNFLFQSIVVFRSYSMFDKCVEFLSADQNMRIVFNTLEGNYALCLLANVIQLAHLERDHAKGDTYYPLFVVRTNAHRPKKSLNP